jgi:hypothetical protein
MLAGRSRKPPSGERPSLLAWAPIGTLPGNLACRRQQARGRGPPLRRRVTLRAATLGGMVSAVRGKHLAFSDSGCRYFLRPARNRTPAREPGFFVLSSRSAPFVSAPQNGQQEARKPTATIASTPQLLLLDTLDPDGQEAGVFIANVSLKPLLFGVECLDRAQSRAEKGPAGERRAHHDPAPCTTYHARGASDLCPQIRGPSLTESH